MSENIDLTPEQKLLIRVWHQKSGVRYTQIFRYMIGLGLYNAQAINWKELTKVVPEWKRLRETKPDQSSLPKKLPIDPDVEKLIQEALREANED